jgi:hypothetical protein
MILEETPNPLSPAEKSTWLTGFGVRAYICLYNLTQSIQDELDVVANSVTQLARGTYAVGRKEIVVVANVKMTISYVAGGHSQQTPSIAVGTVHNILLHDRRRSPVGRAAT